MSHNKKISLFIFGNGRSFKEALISNILGKDISALTRRNILKNTCSYEDDTHQFICTPDLNVESEEMRELFSMNPHPDMCLLVVERGSSPEDVRRQIDHLRDKTRKPANDFRVVLPPGHTTTQFYPIKTYTFDELMKKLKELKSARMRPSSLQCYTSCFGHKQPHTGSHSKTRNKKESKKPAEYRQTYNKRSDDLPESQKSQETDKKVTGEAAVNLVLQGMAGTGKSACGNTILRSKCFTSRVSSKSVTTECQMAEKQINGINVRVIDTPDIFGDDIESSVKKENVKKCKQLCESGPCVYLLVMHVSRFTDGERDILTKLEQVFGSGVKEQTIIVFTRGDDLHRAGMSLESFLGACDPNLKNIVDKCGRRCVLFENSSSHSDQVEKLMAQVKRILKQ
ncbi:uncharacterized protein PAE49_022402 [Odontesthes bonariensis]|uniref:uncharacterized protein LOC142369761 n=1 Tax=Odontesthes bonariensis TaxID=219752 RepID=UPI003F5898CB